MWGKGAMDNVPVGSMKKWPKLSRDRTGMMAKTVRPLTSGAMTLPAGSIVEILDWYRGARISMPTCPHCGIRPYMTHVQKEDLELIEDEV